MNRQIKRKKKRAWDKISCFSICTIKVDIEDLPNTITDYFFKVSDDLLLQCHLNMFYRWRLYPIIVVDGLYFRDSFYDIGKASNEWVEDYYADENFEGYNRFA